MPFPENPSWATLGLGTGGAIVTGPLFWTGLGFNADGVVDAATVRVNTDGTTEGTFSVKALIKNNFGSKGVDRYNAISVGVGVLQMSTSPRLQNPAGYDIGAASTVDDATSAIEEHQQHSKEDKK